MAEKKYFNVIVSIEESEVLKEFCIKHKIKWFRTEYYDKRYFQVEVNEEEKKMIDHVLEEMERKEKRKNMISFRYVVNNEHGGIVFAKDEEEAKANIKRYYALMKDGYGITDENIQIWKNEDDDYYCSEVPDVYECY